MNLGKELIDYCHKQGVKFTFDSDCMVKGCNKIAVWDQTITHQTEGKMVLELCQKHIDDFDKDISFDIEVNKND